MKRFSLFILGVILAVSGRADVAGLVVDDVGNALVGVTVTAATGQVAKTNFDGFFNIEVPPGVLLYFTYDGFRSYQAYAVQNMKVILESNFKGEVRKRTRAAVPLEMFVMLNGMTSFPFSPSLGITFGTVRKGGWYMSLMTGFGFNYSYNGIYYYPYGNNSWSPVFTGKSTHQIFSATIGGVARFGKSPVFWYGGAGYGFKSVTYQTTGGYWLAFVSNQANNFSPMHSAVLETGLLFNIKGVAISAGYEGLIGFGYPNFSASHELKIGVGGMFKTKKGGTK